MKPPGPRSIVKLLKDSLSGWSADNCASMGAALAFYSLLSMAPLVILVITVAGLVIGRDEAQELLFTQLSGLLGDTGAQGVRTVLDASAGSSGGMLATLASGAVLLVGATTVFAELQDDLNRIWKCEAAASGGVWGFVRKRLLSFGLIVAIGFLLLVSLVASAAVSYMGSRWFGGNEQVAHALEFVASIMVMTLLLSLTFKILPARRMSWGDVLLGSLITALLFWIGKFLIGMYIGRSAVASEFGAAGTLVVVIFWVYYSSQIFFFGAQFTRAYSLSHGSKRIAPAANSEFGRDAAMVERARRIAKGRDRVLAERRS